MNNENQAPYSDEIDLLEFFQTIWDGKFKIAAVIVMAVLGVLGFFFTQPAPSFIAKTEVKPITSDMANPYQISNSLGFFEVEPANLRNLFLEQIDTRLLFEDAFRKHDVLDKNDYETETDFNKAIVKLAAGISLLPPINVDGTAKGESRRHWTIEFEFNDQEKWLNVLADVKVNANKNVREIIKADFTTTLAAAQKKKTFEREDISTAIENTKLDFYKEMKEFELKQGFELEDVQTQIKNVVVDYEISTKNRLAFLREQAAIARKLGVAKNTIEAQTFNAQNGMVANVKTDTPFYLRGFEAIEKEIELIESRDDKGAFTSGLLELEQKKRALEQDRTLQRVEKNKEFLDALVELEKKKRQLEQDKTLERAEVLFADTPVMRGDDFSAVVMTVAATEFEIKSNRLMMLVMAVMLGGMIGTAYVLIVNAMRKRNEKVA
ncbi:hypothetical protein [Candidatus Puniceispirillum sp.]|uniref:hypothetical protein n=1 Tax=Candidatus Puniceispirillum sp. TaxID=2026719 RepID=UPI003F696CBE